MLKLVKVKEQEAGMDSTADLLKGLAKESLQGKAAGHLHPDLSRGEGSQGEETVGVVPWDWRLIKISNIFG
jgi:hypothetical protein